MRKLLIAAAALLIPASALAQNPTYSSSQDGAVGALINAVDPSGNARKVILPGVLTISPLTAAINISTATTTTLVAGTSGKSTLVTAWDVMAGGTGNFQLEYGTGGCTTGLTAITGAYPLAAQAGLSKGNGQAVVYALPAGADLCAVTSAAVQYSGSVTYLKN